MRNLPHIAILLIFTSMLSSLQAQDTLYFPCTSNINYEIEIRSRIDGTIATLHIHNEKSVRKGELLATIDATEYEQRIKICLEELKSAQRNVSEAYRVYRRVVSRKQRGAKRRRAIAELSRCRAEVNRAKFALNDARISLSHTNIHAPMDGTITFTKHRVGHRIETNTHITTLRNIDTISLSVTIPLKLYASLILENPSRKRLYNDESLIALSAVYLPTRQRHPFNCIYLRTVRQENSVIIHLLLPNPQRTISLEDSLTLALFRSGR